MQARPRVFKVVPQGFDASHDLVRFLQEEQQHGSEIVLHGYSHRRTGPWQGPWPRRLRAQLFAPGAGEFFSLTPAEAETRLAMGRSILEAAGLSVQGFCAPGWIESPAVRPILVRLGFHYDVAMTHLLDLRSGRRIWTDWVGYMGAGELQESLVGIANRINRITMPAFAVAKVFLHPQGARTRAGCGRVLEWLPWLMQGRQLSTYRLLTGD